MTQLGAHLAATMRLADHTEAPIKCAAGFGETAAAPMGVDDGKDAMRWDTHGDLFGESGLPAEMQAYALRMELVFSDGRSLAETHRLD